MSKGKLIVLEGIDGSGKSSQIEHVNKLFQDKGFETVITREVGGTMLAEEIRSILINNEMPGASQILLAWAARVDHIEKVIKPALDKGKVVISDRFTLSTQSFNAVPNNLEYLHEFLLKQLCIVHPSATLLFDVSPEIAMHRLGKTDKTPDVFESKELEFHKQVRNAYLNASAFNKNVVLIDADQNQAFVEKQITKWFNEFVLKM